MQVMALWVGEEHLLVLVTQCSEDITHCEAIVKVRALQREPLAIVHHHWKVRLIVAINCDYPLCIEGNLQDLSRLQEVLQVKGAAEDLGEGHSWKFLEVLGRYLESLLGRGVCTIYNTAPLFNFSFAAEAQIKIVLSSYL
jgi:hypothetical protein